MQLKICPACGSNKIEKNIKTKILREPFAEEKFVVITEFTCLACGTIGDFFNENDESIDAVYKELKKESAENILSSLEELGISMSAIERILGLPQGIFTKWRSKKTDLPVGVLTLLRFIRLCPWLLEVAENNYNDN